MNSERRMWAGSAVSALNGVIILLALGLAGVLTVPLVDGLSALRRADRAAILAEADRIVFQTTQAMRLSRGMSQTVLQTTDQAMPEISRLRSETASRLEAAMTKIKPMLSSDQTVRAGADGAISA